MRLLKNYASLPGQPYPLNVRLPLDPDLSCPILSDPLPAELPFGQRHNLYQRVKTCIRTHKDLDSISLDQ